MCHLHCGNTPLEHSLGTLGVMSLILLFALHRRSLAVSIKGSQGELVQSDQWLTVHSVACGDKALLHEIKYLVLSSFVRIGSIVNSSDFATFFFSLETKL